MAKGIIIMGVSAIKVEAMPLAVYCTAIKEKETPKKGPKIVPIKTERLALLSLTAGLRALSCRVTVRIIRNERAPVIILISPAAKGIILLTCSLQCSAL